MKIKGVLLALTVLGVLPLELRAQTSQQGEPFQGFYVGVEGGVNWLVNSGYNMNTGWAAGGVVGYDFVGPRFEIEGVFRSNYGTGASTPGTSATSTPPVTSCDSGGAARRPPPARPPPAPPDPTPKNHRNKRDPPSMCYTRTAGTRRGGRVRGVSA